MTHGWWWPALITLQLRLAPWICWSVWKGLRCAKQWWFSRGLRLCIPIIRPQIIPWGFPEPHNLRRFPCSEFPVVTLLTNPKVASLELAGFISFDSVCCSSSFKHEDCLLYPRQGLTVLIWYVSSYPGIFQCHQWDISS
ncbi:hypothetical protein BS47DRAFT_968880 [Hydnum rufescens UP504]|uniref:Uncharacterized protein n=1 Tax=Hydnum rufescens UP504 TaxID=1448309 RepID=A0A9P6DW74_9AGAM|nr:hypothetical protein BS47DRAFT_968880 [Hydnum rufescens UP504]